MSTPYIDPAPLLAAVAAHPDAWHAIVIDPDEWPGFRRSLDRQQALWLSVALTDCHGAIVERFVLASVPLPDAVALRPARATERARLWLALRRRSELDVCPAWSGLVPCPSSGSPARARRGA